VLGALFAKLKMGTLAIRLGPGAAGTINALLLIYLQQRAGAADDTHLAECETRRGQGRSGAAGGFGNWFRFRRIHLHWWLRRS
jgi:hypothetical protein